MEEKITEAIQNALIEAGVKSAVVALKRPPDTAFGDYAVFIGLKHAETVAESVRKSLGTLVSKAEVVGPGFINIKLSASAITFAVAEADAQGTEWGKGITEEGKRVMIEYSNPNAFKEMHIGHLVGTIVGEALSRLIENEGATVVRDTFGGDVGPNVAKALWGLQNAGSTEPTSAKEIGDAYTEGARMYEEDEKIKNEIDALNQALYAGTDTVLMNLWRTGREISMEEFRRIWKLLGTNFDYEFFDSDTAESGLRIVRDGLEKGIFKKSDGAIIYDGESKGVHTMVFITSHDTPTYEAKDIGLAFMREERWPSDQVIIVTGNEQTGRFKTVFSALAELAPLLAKKTSHVATGFLKLTTGKMSSREGHVITAVEFITDIITKAMEKNPDPLIAEQVAIGAIKYMVLRQAPGQDILFDPEKSLSLEGDSGPYLQYAFVRAKKILTYGATGEGGTETPPAPYTIERLIIHFPAVVARATRTQTPSTLVTYLTELAAEWNSFYAREQVLGSPEEAYKQRVARAFANTMSNGLRLLGIPAPEKM